MGNSRVGQQKKNFNRILQDYAKLQDINDPTYGYLELYEYNPARGGFQGQRNNRIGIKRIIIDSDKEFQRTLQHLEARSTIKHPNIIQIAAVDAEQDQGICSTSKVISVIFRHYAMNLSHDIHKRQPKQINYQEGYVWSTLSQLASALRYLQENHIYHGNLKPSTIFLQGIGDPIIADCSLIPGLLDGFQQELRYRQRKSQLSPEELRTLTHKDRYVTQIDRNKSDVFSLGLTILQMITLDDSTDCYDFDLGFIKQQSIEKMFQVMKDKEYSELLSNILKNMLQIDVQTRPDPSQLLDMIEPFQISIGQKLKFWASDPSQRGLVVEQQYRIMIEQPQAPPLSESKSSSYLIPVTTQLVQQLPPPTSVPYLHTSRYSTIAPVTGIQYSPAIIQSRPQILYPIDQQIGQIVSYLPQQFLYHSQGQYSVVNNQNQGFHK